MKKGMPTLVALFALMLAAFAPAASQTQTDKPKKGDVVTYSFDKAHTSIGFKVRHMGITNVPGSFRAYDGSVSFDPEDLSTLQTNLTIDVNSIDTGIERRDNHLRSSDFFEVETYPNITFVSKGVQNVDGSAFELVGDLTIKDVTKEVVLEAEFYGVTPTQRGEKAGFEASTTINRMEYGLMWDRLTELGGLVVAEDVKITLELELNRE